MTEFAPASGRFEMMIVAAPRSARAPEPDAWVSELVYGAFVGGFVPAVPVRPMLLGTVPPSAPVHVHDQVAAYRRDHPHMYPWVLGLPLSSQRLVDVATSYLEVGPEVTAGLAADELSEDPAFCERVASTVCLAVPDDCNVAAVVITNPSGLLSDLPVVPADAERRKAMAARLAAGKIGAVIAVAYGRVEERT